MIHTQLTTVKKRAWSMTLVNLVLDIGLAIAFIIDINVHFTGIAIHEWLGILFAGLLLLHVVFHWDWVVAITKRFFTKALNKDRVNYILNMGLYISFVLIVLSGLMVSKVAMSTLGFDVTPSRYWLGLHITVANLSILLTGLHVALHWKWITKALGRYVWQPLTGHFNGKRKETLSSSA
jgi:hypothetical protein